MRMTFRQTIWAAILLAGGCSGTVSVDSTDEAAALKQCRSMGYDAVESDDSTGTRHFTCTTRRTDGGSSSTADLAKPPTTDGGTTTTIDGAALYNQYCYGCHGNGKKGSAASTIQNAINNNIGGMGSLKFLTSAQIAAIAAAP